MVEFIKMSIHNLGKECIENEDLDFFKRAGG